MIEGAWVCLLAPLAGALAITLAGGRISRRTAGWISTLTTFAAFGGALIALLGLWAADPEDRERVSTAYTWLAAGDFEVGFQILIDPLSSVMMRRSPLIVLLSLEIMLNAANLTLIAFARQQGDLAGQIFALSVMAVAAAEVAIGLGLIVAMARRRLVLDVDQASALRG